MNHAIKQLAALFAAQLVSMSWAMPAQAASTVTSIDFRTEGGSSLLEIKSDGPITYETQQNADDKQIVLELRGAKLSKRVKRKMDTSSFNSKVSLVSPYQVDSSEDTARVVIQLREMAAAEVSQDGNSIRVSIPNGAGGSDSAEDKSNGAKSGDQDRAASSEDGDVAAIEASSKTGLDEFVETSATKRFTGRPITLQVRDADLTDVFRLIGEASGFNIIMGDGVSGKVTLSMVDVPWDQALDVILQNKRLGAERKNNILRVVTLANLTAEKEELQRAKEAAERSAPRVTRVFPISYADAPSLQAILANFGRSGPPSGPGVVAGGAQASASTASGSVQIDQRTNSLIVQDIPENVERMRKLIQLLDTQTPQVMIEAKIIEATESFDKTIEGGLGFGKSDGDLQFGASFNGMSPTDPLLSNPTALTSRSAGGGAFGFSPKLGFLGGDARLNAVLSLLEKETRVKVIGSPRTVVMNKKSASILQGTPVQIPQIQDIPGVGRSTITTIQNANLSMEVTPTVTNSGSVLLVLNLSRDLPFSNSIAPRNLKTEVLVDSGSTLVIGGVYTMLNQHESSGFPFLRKLPLIGAFFGKDFETNSRSELFIFITPRVINEEEAGLSG